VFVALVLSPDIYSSEQLLDADIDTRVEYNDNIFLTDREHDAVTGVKITPSLSGIIREKHWQAILNARLRLNKYSDPNLNGNDQFFDLTGRYLAERNIFALNINHNLDSNLSSTSTDFGVVARRVNRKIQSVTPQYTRLLTERLTLALSYTYSDVDFLEAENSGFLPYITETGNASLSYNLTERDRLSYSAQVIDYKSKNNLVTYQLFISQVGINHQFSETLLTDFQIGVSRRKSTNLSTQTFDFFGNAVVQTQEIDFTDRGFVLNTGITKLFETCEISSRLSRNNSTNSSGGLNQIDRFTIEYAEKLSQIWKYSISTRLEDVTSLSANAGSSDRTVLFLESKINYSITRKWSANASYNYAQRRFKSDTSESRAPHSNRVYVGLIYNFPSLSTF